MNGCSEFLPKVLNKMSALYLMSSPTKVRTQGKEAKEMARYVVLWNVSRGRTGLLGIEMETADDAISAVGKAVTRNGIILERETAEELMKKLQDVIPTLDRWSE